MSLHFTITGLNDLFRSTFLTGRVLLTEGVRALPEAIREEIITKVRAALVERQAAEREDIRQSWEQRRQETRRAFETITREREAHQNAKREQTVAEKLEQARGRTAFNEASQAQKRSRSKDRDRDHGRGDE